MNTAVNSTTSIASYQKKLNALLQKLPEDQKTPALRNLCRTDLYFLIRWGIGRWDIEKQWLFDRCREVQANPNGYLDLWAREHYKSTIITYALTIQDILASHGDDPLDKWHGVEPTFGIFSHSRPIAKGFLRQIKREFESNTRLRAWFDDVIWENPGRKAPKWSEDDGLVLKRKSNPKESTVEAWGLVDGQPTGKHFTVRIYDDVVTLESVHSPEMSAKTTRAWEMSTNLGVAGGYERYIGTRYHLNDTYRTIMERQGAKPRIYPATEDGSVGGAPVMMTSEEIEKKRRIMGPYTFATQMLQDPMADATQGFKPEWLKYAETHTTGLNVYMIVDPANSKKKSSDYTAAWVIGYGEDNNFSVLDIIRDRLSLTERADMLFDLHRQWEPINVGYEQYGMQADIEHIEDRMQRENYRFDITPLGGKLAKNDRIRRLVPIFEQGRIYLPEHCYKSTHEGKNVDLVQEFVKEEYLIFPVGSHDDMLDSLSRIEDIDIAKPNIEKHVPRPRKRVASAWMR